MTRDRTDRRLTRLIQGHPIAWIYEYDNGRVSLLWRNIREDGRRAVRRRRMRRAFRWVLIQVLILLIGGLLVSCLYKSPAADAFRLSFLKASADVRGISIAVKEPQK